MLLLEVLLVLPGSMSRPLLETSRPSSIGYSSGPERDELVVLLEVGEVSVAPSDRRAAPDLARPLELRHERVELAPSGAR